MRSSKGRKEVIREDETTLADSTAAAAARNQTKHPVVSPCVPRCLASTTPAAFCTAVQHMYSMCCSSMQSEGGHGGHGLATQIPTVFNVTLLATAASGQKAIESPVGILPSSCHCFAIIGCSVSELHTTRICALLVPTRDQRSRYRQPLLAPSPCPAPSE